MSCWNSHRRGIVASALAGALAAIVGCSSSPPTRFYTLSETAPEARSAPPGVGPVRIARVTIPGELDRPELVRRLDPNRLGIDELDRWAAPLDEMIQRVLSEDVNRRLRAESATGAGESSRATQQHAVSVDIREFYGDAACNVTLHAAWAPEQPPPRPAEPVTEEIHVAASGACPGTLAATMSIALGQLSDRIIAGVASRAAR